jgi:hypothetical protein
MKILFFLALLANVIFFLWLYQIGTFNHSNVEQKIDASKPKQILLLSELKQQPTTVAPIVQKQPAVASLISPASVIARPADNNPQHLVTSIVVNPATVSANQPAPAPTANVGKPEVITAPTPAVAVAIAPKPSYCYQIGMFNDKASAKRSVQQVIGKSAVQIKEIPPAIADYLVYFPAAANSPDGKNNAEVLKAQGINDFFMINKGEFKGSLSLGVFKNERRAIKSQQLFIEKGVQAQVAKRYKTEANFFYTAESDKTKVEILASLPKYTFKPNVKRTAHCD